jgi:hypothetical protein
MSRRKWDAARILVAQDLRQFSLAACAEERTMSQVASYITLNRARGARGEVAAMRRSVTRGSPFGTAACCERMACQLGLEGTLHPRCRPRKKAEDGAAMPFSGGKGKRKAAFPSKELRPLCACPDQCPGAAPDRGASVQLRACSLPGRGTAPARRPRRAPACAGGTVQERRRP